MTDKDERGEGFLAWEKIGPRLIYLLLSFPTGIASFVFTVTLLSVGLATLIVGVGIPILLALFAGSRGFLALDRGLSRTLLGTELPEPPRSVEPPGLLRRLIFQAGRLETWSALLYMLLKLPLGILSFVISVVAVVLPLSLAIAAFLSLFLTALPIELGWDQTVYLDPLSGAALLGLVAVLFGFLGTFLVLGLGKVWEALHGVFLGVEAEWVAPSSGAGQAVVIP